MASIDDPFIISLIELKQGCPALTPAAGLSLAEAASVCLDEQGHGAEAALLVISEYVEHFNLRWLDVTEQMRLCYHDAEEATELGACAIAILLMRELTEMTIVERSRKGTGFDYWLGKDEAGVFQGKARLEVSGIRKGDRSVLEARVRQKVRQTRRSDGVFPAYIVVVEFSQPAAQVKRR